MFSAREILLLKAFAGTAASSELCFTPDGETLVLENGTLSVNTADTVESGNNRPVTSAAVHTVVGNIEVLLGTI